MAKFPIGKTRVGQTLHADIKHQVRILNKRLSGIEKGVSEATVNALAEIAQEILKDSNRACPVDSGELRNSAKAFIARQGRRDLHEIYGISGAGNKDPESGEVTGAGLQAPQLSKEWNLYVSYNRFNNKGQDIAVWTHEDLNPHGGSSPAAKQPGTGPKYLENSFNDNYKSIENTMAKMMRSQIKSMTSGFKVVKG